MVTLIRIFSLSTLLVVCGCPVPVEAQDPRTPPYRAPHKETGEPGVWIPIWLQQEHLADAAKLDSCTEAGATTQALLSERGLEADALRQGSEELREANEALLTSLAGSEMAREEAEGAAENRLYWALTSTTVGVVALSILIVLVAK